MGAELSAMFAAVGYSTRNTSDRERIKVTEDPSVLVASGTILKGAGMCHERVPDIDDMLGDIPPWVSEAPCAQTDPEAFFPGKGGATFEAKAVCASCPVREMCLEYALSVPACDDWGVWGGTSVKERNQIRRARRQEAA